MESMKWASLAGQGVIDGLHIPILPPSLLAFEGDSSMVEQALVEHQG